MAIDPTTSQSLYDALKGFINAGASTQHSALYEFGKDYQTVIAAVFALGAGLMAYLSAMAGVRESRRKAKLANASRRLGLLIRVRAAAESARSSAEYLKPKVDEWIAKATPAPPPNASFGLEVAKASDVDSKTWTEWQANLPLAAAPEFGEAWKRVELFPMEAVDPLRSLTICSQQLDILAKEGIGKPASYAKANIAQNALKVTVIEAGKVVETLDVEIETLSRFVKKNSM
jgi:hypothetical protein